MLILKVSSTHQLVHVGALWRRREVLALRVLVHDALRRIRETALAVRRVRVLFRSANDKRALVMTILLLYSYFDNLYTSFIHSKSDL